MKLINKGIQSYIFEVIAEKNEILQFDCCKHKRSRSTTKPSLFLVCTHTHTQRVYTECAQCCIDTITFIFLSLLKHFHCERAQPPLIDHHIYIHLLLSFFSKLFFKQLKLKGRNFHYVAPSPPTYTHHIASPLSTKVCSNYNSTHSVFISTHSLFILVYSIFISTHSVLVSLHSVFP